MMDFIIGTISMIAYYLWEGWRPSGGDDYLEQVEAEAAARDRALKAWSSKGRQT